MRINVYVDGFNLYYRCLKGSAYKWLNLMKLCQRIFPNDEINLIRYFTALISSPYDDPGKSQRQQIYLRALSTLPNLSIHYGQFRSNIINMPLASSKENATSYALVKKTEEKGSDVNLASYLIRDGFLGEYQKAIIISNDSDPTKPVEIVREDLKIPVGTLNPQRDRKHISVNLKQASTFHWFIKERHLRKSQFPDQLTDTFGPFRKPSGW